LIKGIVHFELIFGML